MMTAFFLLFYKDQRSELGEGHERYYWKVEVSTRQDYQVLHLDLFRSSHQRCSTGVRQLTKRCSKFTTKFTKNFLKFIKLETLDQLFFCEFCEISEDTFFTEHLLIFIFFIDLLSYLPLTSCVASYILVRYLILSGSVLQLS